jgi:hypothetical protein
MWISTYPLVEIDIFSKVPHLLWVWNFVNMDLTHLQIRIRWGSFKIYSKKWFFGLQNSASFLEHRENNFFSTLNAMILQMRRNNFDLTNYGQKKNLEINQLVSVGCRDLRVSADSAGCRESKNRKLKLKNILFFYP